MRLGLPPRLRRGAGGAGGGRGAGPRRRPLPARRGARLRCRAAGEPWRSAAGLPRREPPQHAQHRRDLRRGGGGRRARPGLDAQRMRWMLGLRGAAGLRRSPPGGATPDHIEKAFVFGGMPARNGVTAALLVHGGATGIEDVFSGADNFLLAHVADAKPPNWSRARRAASRSPAPTSRSGPSARRFRRRSTRWRTSAPAAVRRRGGPRVEVRLATSRRGWWTTATCRISACSTWWP